MKYIIIINDGKGIFHLGQNKDISIITKGVYYALMSIPIDGENVCFEEKELVAKLNISRKDFNSSFKELSEIALTSNEKNGCHEYNTVYNTELLRAENPVIKTIDKQTGNILYNISAGMAYAYSKRYSLEYTHQNISKWVGVIRTMYSKDKIGLQNLIEVTEWYKKNIGNKYIPIVNSPTMFKGKWASIVESKNRQEKDYTVKKGTNF